MGCENQEDEEMKILNTSKKEHNKELYTLNTKYTIFFSGAAGID